MKKKLLSILLAAVLAVSMALPALSASAEETPAGSTVSESVSIGDSTHSYSVTLPKGYQKDSGRSYPVVYLLPDDGRSAYQNDVVKLYEDAMASAGGIDMILVTTGFSANDDFRAVMKAIAEDVDTKYDTIAEAKYRTAAGTGTGGYMAYILGFTSADGGAPLTTPETFGSIISIRGNFVDNIWYAKYGDVYDILTAAKTSSSKFYNNFYTYLDAPTEDAWSAMTHSTNELGSLFISWSSAHSYNVHEFTTRNGVYNKAFLEESVARVMDRLASNLVPVTSGTVSVSPTAMRADVENTTASYTVKIGSDFTKFFGDGSSELSVTIKIADSSSGEALYTNTAKQPVSAAGDITGAMVIPNKINGTSSTVTLTLSFMGYEFEADSTPIVRIQETGKADDEQLIDLMGDWYFNFVGRTDPYTVSTLDKATYETWSLVQPALDWWLPGFGNITSQYMSIGWAWYARTFTVPADFTKENLLLLVGYCDDRAEVFVNGKRIGGTGINDEGVPTGDTTWAVLNIYDLDASVLNYGGENTIYVHMQNDSIGGGGWYSGPVGVYSQAAYNKSLGLPSATPEKTVEEKVIAAVEAQNKALCDKNLDAYAATIAYDYFASGVTKQQKLDEIKAVLKGDGSVLVKDTDLVVFETTDENGNALYQYNAKRAVTAADGSKSESSVQEIYTLSGDTVLMYGDHSRFFETSYQSAEAAKASKSEQETVEEKYIVYLPEDYFTSDAYYPTVYLLHQINSDHTSYITDKVNELLDDAMESGALRDTIVVIPNSSESSWWQNGWDTMITDELIPLIDKNYRTIQDARYRTTAGCSMGGFGAYNVGIKNPDEFSGVVSFFGALSSGGLTGIFETESAEYLSYYSHYFICGNHDTYSFGRPAITIDKSLREKGVEHTFFIENGEHDSVFYVPYFIEGLKYVIDRMPKGDTDALTALSKGELAVTPSEDGAKASLSFSVGADIAKYLNVIPASSYTKNSNPALQIPLVLEITQNGKTVSRVVNNDFSVLGADSTEWALTLDSADVDFTKDYTVTAKAALLDTVVTLDSFSYKAPSGGDEPGGNDKPGGDDKPGDNDEPGGDDKPGDNDKPGDGGDVGTGDALPAALGLCLLASSAALFVLRKRRHQ